MHALRCPYRHHVDSFVFGCRAPALARSRTTEIRHLRIHKKAPAQGAAAEQHAETHVVAIRERHLDRPCLAAYLHLSHDHQPTLAMAARIADHTLVHHRCLAHDLDVRTALIRMDGEARDTDTAHMIRLHSYCKHCPSACSFLL